MPKIKDTLYFKYISEWNDLDVLETDKGFILYSSKDEELYIEDIYVKPEYRKDNTASELADAVCKIGKERNCTYLKGVVIPGAKAWIVSCQVLEGYGMSHWYQTEDRIYFRKDIDV